MAHRLEVPASDLEAVVLCLTLGTPYTPVLSAGMDVQGCHAAIWRVQAYSHVSEPQLTCRWHALPGGADGGLSSGEGLDAHTWTIARATLSLGTKDGERLAARARHGLHMAPRLAPHLDPGTVHYLPDGLQVPFPSLHPGELVQVHFTVAWSATDHRDRIDTWVAVDQRQDEILRQLGLSGGPIQG